MSTIASYLAYQDKTTGQVRFMGGVSNPSASFTRPADTTAYASADLVANSTTAGSVTPLSFTFSGGSIRRARLRKSGTSTTNASFRLHLYTSSPTPANGDNGAFSTSGSAGYVGAIDITVDQAFTDGAVGHGYPNVTPEIMVRTTSDLLYGLLEARAAYTPSSAEVFAVTLEAVQD